MAMEAVTVTASPACTTMPTPGPNTAGPAVPVGVSLQIGWSAVPVARL